MNASHSTRAGVGIILTTLALTLAGCAKDSALMERPTALGPSCAAPMGPAQPDAPMLGCANRSNLAAQAADPADLRQGKVLASASGAREAAAVEAYNKGPKAVTAGGSGVVLSTTSSSAGSKP